MTADVVIAGGGPAGAAAACLLARAGRSVLLIERETAAADKICGEFLSTEAQHYLRDLGLDLPALGAQPIAALRLVRGASVVTCALPFAGAGLSRRVLDEALLRHAGRCGAEVRRGVTVSLRQDRAPIVLTARDGAAVRADTLFLATGKHDLKGLPRPAGSAPDLVGFKLHLRLARAQRDALAGHVEILLLDGGYAGLQPVGEGIANLCLLVERSRLLDVGGSWDGLLRHLQRSEPHLRTRLDGAAFPTRRPLSIYRVPYGFVHAPQPDDAPGIWRLGDQVGVIPSFTGDGMSIALHSAAVAAACHLAGVSAADYHRRIRHDIAGHIGRAAALYRLGAGRQAALMTIASIWPGGLRLAARVTRVPQRAMQRAMLQAAGA